ncbi:EamA family transporter [Shewanella sp. VB17]|uniref:DMT family transporter n=1 Tax=Shewanella sp. VB17 TaxID=2739432 RepID=UPI001566126E|nr:DMT family transporter [Shewanella sp. VB17]NRD72506.1 EamA family transporter [Shewanella sp. VB17]
MNILLAMIPAFFWGTTYAVSQFSLTDWPPLLLGALRALPAGLLLFAIKPTFLKKQDWWVLCRLGAINIAAFFSFIFIMAQTLPAAISGVGMLCVPVFAMLFHWAVSGGKPNPVQAFFAGLLIVLAWFLFDPSSISLNLIGLLAMLAAIMCIIIGSRITKSLGDRLHWWTILSWQLIIGGSLLSIAVLCHSFYSPAAYIKVVDEFSQNNAAGLLWIILLNTALGYSLYVWLLQRMSVVDFTFGGIANPVAGIVSGMLLLNEAFTLTQYLLMASMILTSLMPQIILIIKEKMIKNKYDTSTTMG